MDILSAGLINSVSVMTWILLKLFIYLFSLSTPPPPPALIHPSIATSSNTHTFVNTCEHIVACGE